MDNCVDFLKKYISNEDIIVLACSGGPDSMCLFDIVKKNIKNKVIVVCVNHNVRKEALMEFEYVKKYSLDSGCLFEGLTIDADRKYSEDDFRNIRYDFFRKVIKKYNATKLLTAHHGDDLIETVLMRIVRGSDLNGYIGIKSVVDKGNYQVLRPLIFVSKDEIIHYNKINNIKYFNDYTNDLDEYTRNRYRHHVLPFLKSENKDVHKKFLRFSNELEKSESFINSIVMKSFDEVVFDNKLKVDSFKELDLFIQVKIIKKMLSDVYKEKLYCVDDNTVNNILDMIHNNNSNSKICLPNGIIGYLNYGSFYLLDDVSSKIELTELTDGVVLNNGFSFKFLDASNEKSNFVIRLSLGDVRFPLMVRSRVLGDIISVKGLDGSKKVKDIFIDEKINIEDRNMIPIVTDADNNVIWIPGIKKSKFDREINEKYDIIIKYVKEDINE